jgi:hypothetical protein
MFLQSLRYKIYNWFRVSTLVDDNKPDSGAIAKSSPKHYGTLAKDPKFRGRSESGIESDPIRIIVYNGIGGMVVEVRLFDHAQQEYVISLYVIPSDKDLGNEIASILTMISLQR